MMFGSTYANSHRELSCFSSLENDGHKKANGRKNNNGKRKGGKEWRKTLIIKGQWNSEEDRLLVQLVKQHGDSKWSKIAEKLPGRIAKQCRDRWQNHLRPDITKDAWSEEEDRVLIAIHKQVGNKWSEIARRMPGRSENTIKNHWNATKRRQLSSRKRGKPKYQSLLQEYIRSVSPPSSSSSHVNQKIDIQENDVKKPQMVVAPIPPPQTNFSYSHVNGSSSSSLGAMIKEEYNLGAMIKEEYNLGAMIKEEYNLGAMMGYIPGGSMLNESSLEFDHGPFHLSSQLEFDLKKEMDFLEMLYQ